MTPSLDEIGDPRLFFNLFSVDQSSLEGISNDKKSLSSQAVAYMDLQVQKG